MAETGHKWYVIRTFSGKEKKVKEQLELEIKRDRMQDLVSQILIPTEKVYQIKNGKKITKERNYLPGYVLISCQLIGELEHLIQKNGYVVGFLGGEKGGNPVPMRTSEVNRILGKVDELAVADEEVEIPYIVGDKVKVTDGPFNNFNGVIEEVQEEKKKLIVMVKIFGRKTPLELNYFQVSKEG